MIKTEFGIIDEIDADKDYSHYEPEKYNCVYIDDDIYIDEWWEQLQTIKTFYHSLNRPGYALARYGVTIIPWFIKPVSSYCNIRSKIPARSFTSFFIRSNTKSYQRK